MEGAKEKKRLGLSAFFGFIKNRMPPVLVLILFHLYSEFLHHLFTSFKAAPFYLNSMEIGV